MRNVCLDVDGIVQLSLFFEQIQHIPGVSIDDFELLLGFSLGNCSVNYKNSKRAKNYLHLDVLCQDIPIQVHHPLHLRLHHLLHLHHFHLPNLFKQQKINVRRWRISVTFTEMDSFPWLTGNATEYFFSKVACDY